MKKIVFMWQLWLFGLFAVFVSSCASEELSSIEEPEVLEFKHSADWKETAVMDTVFLTCNQIVSYNSTVLYPKAYIKLWVTKNPISFSKGENPKPQRSGQNASSYDKGSSPKKKYQLLQYNFSDKQTIFVETMYEIYNITFNGQTYTAPFVMINDTRFNSLDVKSLNENDGTYSVLADFDIDWQTINKDEKGTKKATISYTKKELAESDVLLQTDYNKGFEWLGENAFTLYVEKTETWKLAGKNTQKFSSPSLSFSFSGKENRTLSVDDFNFTYNLQSNSSTASNLGNNGWNIQKSTTTKTATLKNATTTFSDVFEFPSYKASYTLDGKTYDFDLNVDFDATHRLTKISEEKAQNVTSATANFLGRSFTKDVTTTLNLRKTDPTPDPDPDPDPNSDAPKHGQILGYNVTAVFNVDAVHGGGDITKKCVTVRYETGYDWGVCDYDESFPASVSYIQSGYSGFNSAAQPEAGKPFRIARAADVDMGIKWYAENNSLVSAIDVVTCKVLGWRNIVNGSYSCAIGGYKATYSNDRYTLTITAPDGKTMVFRSQKK